MNIKPFPPALCTMSVIKHITSLSDLSIKIKNKNMFNIIKNIVKLPVDVVKDVATMGLYNSIKTANGEKTTTPFATLDRLIKIAKDTD